MKFNVGDRVAVYGHSAWNCLRGTGTVSKINTLSDFIRVDIDPSENTLSKVAWCHTKQVRKLKRRDRIWVHPKNGNVSLLFIDGWDQYVKVKK